MQEWNGTLTKDMHVKELARVIVEHWNAGACSMLFIDDMMNACRALDVSADSIADFVKAVNDYRHHDYAADVLNNAFVPVENVQAVCDLLDQIQGLCVRA